jgi:thiosulfate dehydrogenase [quinone] large subunit
MAILKMKAGSRTDCVWGPLRILLGWLFLWGFLDKLFGLGYATPSSGAWINGGSPTAGYLKFAAGGIFQGFYNSVSGNGLVDWLFMLALLALGIALILGIGMRIAAYGGTLFLLLLWSSHVPPTDNPIIDEHIIYIFVLWGLYLVKAGRIFGLGDWWVKTGLVKRFPILE